MTARCPKLDVETPNDVSPSCRWTFTTKMSAADWLALAAAPSFALMALLTGVAGGAPDTLCSQGASPLTGMVPMYVLMSAFHSGPWLRLIARRRNG